MPLARKFHCTVRELNGENETVHATRSRVRCSLGKSGLSCVHFWSVASSYFVDAALFGEFEGAIPLLNLSHLQLDGSFSAASRLAGSCPQESPSPQIDKPRFQAFVAFHDRFGQIANRIQFLLVQPRSISEIPDSFLVKFVLSFTPSFEKIPMRSRAVLDFLRSEVDRTNREYSNAKQHFWNICMEAPSGLPHPDGKQRLDIAARAQSGAMIAYAEALRRFNDFLLDGAIPEDLADSAVTQPVRQLEMRPEIEKCVCCGAKTRLREHAHPICVDCSDLIDAGKKPRGKTSPPRARRSGA